MQLKSIAAIIVLLLVSLSIAGCTIGLPSSSSPTPTYTPSQSSPIPTQPTDFSSYYNSQHSENIVKQFEKSTNLRGNDVYTGIVKNTHTPTSTWTLTHELTQSEADAKAAVNAIIIQKTNEGFMAKPEEVAALKTQMAGAESVWIGVNRAGESFEVNYNYDSGLWWVFSQESHTR